MVTINEPRVNNRIRASRVKVIAEDGEQLGDLGIRDALAKAEEMGLDLVEVAPNANPPVCRVMDYGKYKYKQKKKTQKSKAKQHIIHVKEIKLRPMTEKHDYDFKMDHARKFLEKGDKVKISVFFRGREMAHKELGEKILAKVIDDFGDLVKVEQTQKMQGRIMSMVFAPKNSNTTK